MNRKLRLPLALALALGSSHALALGLGQAEVKSSLYEPLVAEIPVLSTTPGETESLTVRLASPEAFERVGLPRPPTLAANLQFAIVRNESGQQVVRITTKNRVSDPFMSFLIEADWGKGRLLREFTLLLDPPTTAPARAVTRAPVRQAEPARQPEPAPAQPRPQPAEPAPAEVPRTMAPTPAPAPEQPRPQPPAQVQAGGEYGPVGSGETLWSIAQRTRPDSSVSMNQMMMALLRANPDAFIGDNINLIKRGAILRIPDLASIGALDAAQAGTLVREQMEAWRSGQTPQLQPAEPEPDATVRAPERAGTPDSRLELVPPRGDRPAAGARSGIDADADSGAELRAELARAREEVGARQQEISELRSRVQELEGLREDSQRYIALKDSELAALQARLAELEAARSAADASPADAAATPPPDIEGTDTETVAADAQPPVSEAQPLPDDSAPADAEPLVEAEAEAPPTTVPARTDAAPPEAQPPVATPEQPRAQPWYRNLWVIGGIVALVVGLLTLLLLRRRSAAAAEEPVLRNYDTAARAAPVPVAAVADSGESAREAELLDALAERPEDLARHLDLVRYYYEQGDVDAFEGAAEAMYAQVYDPDNLMWKQVVAMGRELLPDHPLFAAAAAADADVDAAEAAEAPWNTGEYSVPETEASYEAADDTPAEPAPGAQDWTAESDADADATQQIRFEDLEPGRYDAGEAAQEPAPEPASYDYEPATAAPAAPEPTVFDEPADEQVDEQRAAEPAAEAQDWGGGDDAASTKLELARAYLDMGDVEGARGMLEEVMSEGNPGQRAEAKRLLDEIR